MDRKSNQKISAYLKACAVFVVVFSVFMLVLARYEISLERQRLISLVASHPELEAEIISLWEKPQENRSLETMSAEEMDKAVHVIEDKYGYRINNMMSGKIWVIFWGIGILAGVMIIGFGGYLKEHKKRAGAVSGENLKELHECLEQFRKGDYEAVPDYEGDSEEWMKLWESMRELGEYFTELRTRLQQEEDSTKTLITDISHQLKTPLASLRMSHELVMGSQLTEEEKDEFMEQEEKEIEKLEMLLSELVNLSRLEAQMIQIRPVSASLRETITAAVGQIYMKARSKHIDIQVEMDGDMEICHDVKWTEEAISNVLDNAVKYSGEHTRIMVRVIPLIKNVLIEIEDEGMGLKPEEITKVYQRFYRGVEAREKVKEGAGVGLYLTRMILERQGGTISAKRKIEKGTIFKITLPC